MVLSASSKGVGVGVNAGLVWCCFEIVFCFCFSLLIYEIVCIPSERMLLYLYSEGSAYLLESSPVRIRLIKVGKFTK